MSKFYQMSAISLLMVLLLSVIAIAQSDIPHQFAGSVTVNGAPAADGVLVVAKIDGKDVAGTTTSGGKYGYNPVFVVPDPYRNREGKTIEFYVSGVKAAEYIFENGGQTFLDLSVTVSTGGNEGNGGTGGGGGGGSAGGGSSPSTPPATENPPSENEGTCTENWQCTEWLDCYNGKQSRVCTDLNQCGTENNKPSEKQECYVKICDAGETRCDGDELLVCPQSEDIWVLTQTCENGCSDGKCMGTGGAGFDLTGMIAGSPATAGAIIGLIVIVAAGLYFGKFRRKK